MKNLILLLFLLPFLAVSQNEFVTVQIPFDCSDYDIKGRQIEILPDGNYFLLGNINIDGTSHPCVIIQDQNGNTLSSNYYSGGFTSFNYKIDESTNSIFCVGTAQDAFDHLIYLSNIDFSGNLIIDKFFEVENELRTANPIIDIFEDNIFVHCWVMPSGQPVTITKDDIFVLHFNTALDLLNHNRFCTEVNCTGVDEEVNGIDILNDSEIILAGQVASGTPRRGLIHTLDFGLNTTNFLTSNTQQVILRDVLVTSGGNIISGGEDRAQTDKTVLFMLNSSFATSWAVEFTVDAQRLIIREILETGTQIIVIGDITNTTTGTDDVYILYFDEDGVLTSAQKHITSVEGNKYNYGALNNEALVGFVNNDYSMFGNTYPTVETFVAHQNTSLCVFEDADVEVEEYDIEFVDTDLHEFSFSLSEEDLNNETQIPIVEKHICYPCDSTTATAAELDGNFKTALPDQTNNSGNIDQDLIIYPNPTNGELTFDLINYEETEIELKVYNIEGRVVYTGIVTGGTTQKLNLELNTGIYLIQMDGEPFGKIMFE